jgi:hypothetical protein
MNTAATISVSLGSGGSPSTSANTTIDAPILSKFTISPSTVTGADATNGQIVLGSAAPLGGLIVSLSTTNAGASVPATVVVPAGSTSVEVPITTIPVASNTTGTVTVTLGSASLSASLTVDAPEPAYVKVSPSATILGGKSATGTVALNAVTAAAFTVYLFSANSAVSVPTTVVVAAGASSATFPITTTTVSAASVGAITASASASDSSPVSTTITVNAP